MIGISGEYANGVPQAGTALTHISDRSRTDSGSEIFVSGVSVLNDVIDSVTYDLGLPHDAWDSCSYMNVVNQLGDIHTLQDVTSTTGKTQSSCALSLAALVHEIASNYDENMGLEAETVSGQGTSALATLYGVEGTSAAILLAMGSTSTASTASQRHTLVLSVMFKNSTPGVRNVEFRIHFLVTDAADASVKTLKSLCDTSSNPANYRMDGTQS